MPIAPSRNKAGASRFVAGHGARTAPAASAQASSTVKNQRQKVSASGGSQPAARRATRMLAANIAGAPNSRAYAPTGVFMAFGKFGRSWRIRTADQRIKSPIWHPRGSAGIARKSYQNIPLL